MSNDEKSDLKKIKTSVSSRSLSLAKIGMQAGLSYLNHKMQKSLSANDAEKNAQLDSQFLTKQSANLSQELGQLKGSLMKAGQMLSMYGEYFLPPEANNFLKKLQSDSPPVEWSQIDKALKSYLSPDQLDMLRIEEKAYACASMGQVHRAQIKSTGDWVALKIQYPNVDKAIESDLKALKSILNLMGLFPKDFNPDPLFSEVKEMLEQETKYDLEAQLTTDYSIKLEADTRFLVPKVYNEFSAQKILATQFMPGVRADDPIVKSLSQKRRNALSESFLHLYFKELFDWQYVQTDPHLGNYKVKVNFDEKDQLVLLDFGATRKFQPEFMKQYKELIRASLYDNVKEFNEISYQMGFLKVDDPSELKLAFQEFCFATLEPFKIKNYNWKTNDLPQRVSKMAMKIVKEFPLRSPPQDMLFLDRKTGGVFIFLAVLGAEINGREILEQYLATK